MSAPRRLAASPPDPATKDDFLIFVRGAGSGGGTEGDSVGNASVRAVHVQRHLTVLELRALLDVGPTARLVLLGQRDLADAALVVDVVGRNGTTEVMPKLAGGGKREKEVNVKEDEDVEAPGKKKRRKKLTYSVFTTLVGFGRAMLGHSKVPWLNQYLVNCIEDAEVLARVLQHKCAAIM